MAPLEIKDQSTYGKLWDWNILLAEDILSEIEVQQIWIAAATGSGSWGAAERFFFREG